MDISSYISFTDSLLKKMHVSSRTVKDPDNYMSKDIDLGLRAMLFGEKDYSKLLLNSPTEAESNVVYRFFDEYRCNYVFFKIPEVRSSSFYYVGPYLTALPSEEFIKTKSESLSLNGECEQQFRMYYRNLPIIEDESILISIVNTLGSFIWGGDDNFNMEYVDYEIPDKRRPVYVPEFSLDAEIPDSRLSFELAESNYLAEKQLMEAVSKGKLNKVEVIASSLLNRGTEERLSDSLRNRKNYLIILNTVLRKAAENGNVHPYHIHRLSSFFAARIEALYSVESSIDLQKQMIRKYCVLVKEQSLNRYSNLVGRVITLISCDLTADLSLKSIADQMNVNPSYLSAVFKKECGETLTDYVNRKRMENAVYILTHSSKQVQVIAEECGILDVNYFIKLFKRRYGVTPMKYRTTTLIMNIESRNE